jgi:DNA-binding winged helix-turn-helix (wHTH) protein
VPVKLGSRALDILWLLVSRAGDVVSKNELLAHAWPGLIVEEINLRVHIAEVRKALGDGKEGARYITNIPSRGYCFVAPVQRIADAPSAVSIPVQVPGVPEMPAPILPHRLERMIGRDEVVREISQRLLSERFITLRGPGGIGKTTVAIWPMNFRRDSTVRFAFSTSAWSRMRGLSRARSPGPSGSWCLILIRPTAL